MSPRFLGAMLLPSILLPSSALAEPKIALVRVRHIYEKQPSIKVAREKALESCDESFVGAHGEPAGCHLFIDITSADVDGDVVLAGG